jgi:hypothetical protein
MMTNFSETSSLNNLLFKMGEHKVTTLLAHVLSVRSVGYIKFQWETLIEGMTRHFVVIILKQALKN